MKNLKSLSVFFPCLNDGKSLPYLLDKTYKVLPKITQNYEVIVIDDGSTDESREIIKRIQRRYENLKLFVHPKNLGYGAVLMTGFKKAAKEWVFYTDGDGQYDPSELIKLVDKTNNKIDVVNGYKIRREDNTVRRLTGSIYNFMIQKIYSLPIRDIDCDFRLIRKSSLSKIKLSSKSGLICLELIYKLKKAKARFAEAPVHHYKRLYGRSQFFKFPRLYSMLKDHINFFVKNG